MARTPPVVALNDARITFGGRPLFDGLSMSVVRSDRVCLVGRNGCGKSTLLKALAGEIELDGGARFLQPAARVVYLPQDPVVRGGQTVTDYVAAGVAANIAPDARLRAVATMLADVSLDGARRLGTLSGGETRRAALARALVGDSDVLLLDEPTNHLDLPTIEWLERSLERYAGGLVVVSHDRALLARLTRRTLWLDRGDLRCHDQGFAAFEGWSAERLATETRDAAKLDRRIAEELRWRNEGLTARRKRNEGRLRRLHEMRRARAERVVVAGRAKLAARGDDRGPRLVIEAEDIAKTFGANGAGAAIIDGFTTRILRGDRIGVIGANGAGKTTLVRLLSGTLAPDRGTVRLGAGVEAVYFDQRREALDPEATLWETLCGAGDTVMVGGRPRHVVGYLRDFLFEERQALSPVKSLSGGERNRLLLAKLLARPSTLLVLDEPTNDLDMETLDLLQDVLGEYDGTLLVVSHDRDFLDHVATSIIALEGGGRATEYAGGYTDYLAQRGAARNVAGKPARPKRPAPPRERRAPTRLGYNESRELDRLPPAIEALAAELRALEASLADPVLYHRDRVAFESATARHAAATEELAAAETRWLELETLREKRAAQRR